MNSRTPVLRHVARVALILATLAAAGALVAGASAGGAESPVWPLWRRLLGAAGCLSFAVAVALGRPWRGGVDRSAMRTSGLVVAAVGVLVTCLASPVSDVGFLPYGLVVVLVGSRRIAEGWWLLTAPVAAQGVLLWTLTRQWSAAVIGVVTVLVVAALLEARHRRREAEELEAAQAAMMSEERARTAAAERQRDLAAQIHDVLAHSLSGLAVSLQVAALQAAQEGASPELRARLTAAHDLAREGLRGAREAVGVLRGDLAITAPADAGDADAWVADVVRRLRGATGAEVVVAGSLTGLPPDRRTAVEAVVREALTNSVRHAPGAPVEVTLAPAALRVLTRGDVTGARRTDHAGGGRGLAGLRERVEASGGRFAAGLVPEGWEVAAEWTP